MPARPSAGTTLGIGTADIATTPTAPGVDTFTIVPEVTGGLNGPNAESPEIETTALDATSRTYIADLQDPGTLDFTLNVDGAALPHRTIEGDANTPPATRASRNWQITYADGTIVDVEGFVQSFNRTASQGSPVQASVTVRVISAPTITYPA